MVDFANSRGIRGVAEERQFTNPHVRFRRIRGRIVPIFNKKRIGQDSSSLGMSVMGVGSAVTGASLAKRTKIGRKIGSFSHKATGKISSFVDSESLRFLGRRKRSLKSRVGLKVINSTIKATRGMFKHSGKLGLLGLGIGLATKIAGDELQARSPFGKDYFFTKDRDGRGS